MHTHRLLQTFATALLLAACAAASVVPDWATVLKAQSYYGSVDLRLSVQSPGGVRAGADADLLVTLANAGPDDAHGARTHASVHAAAVSATSGCNEDPLGFPDCTLAAPLPAGGSADYLMHLSVPPLARGSVTVALSAQSWDLETAPGQETALLELPIEAHVDLRASVLCDRAYLTGGGSLSCQLILHNFGPSAALSPRFEFDLDGADAFDFSCNATHGGLCPPALSAKWTSAVMQPRDTAVLWFQLAPARGVDTATLGVTVTGSGEIEDQPSDNAERLSIPVVLFRDDFEGVPASAR